MAEDPVAATLVEPLPEPFQKRNLVLAHPVYAPLLDILHTRGQPGDSQHIGCPTFQKIGKFQRLRLACRVASRAPLAPGAQLRS